MITETKEEILGRLIKDEHITFEEALKLMETKKEYVPYQPFTPYEPINPYPLQPYYYEWKNIGFPSDQNVIYCLAVNSQS